jgi:4-alpha-glucanotransferase
VLLLVFENFMRDHWKENSPLTDRGRAFERYVEKEGGFLDDYAAFMTLERHFREKEPEMDTWKKWPAAFHNPGSRVVSTFRRQRWKELAFEKYLQWQIELQLQETDDFARQQGLVLGIYHDLAMAEDSCGSEAWAHRDLFVPNVRVGAPPDDFSQNGQDWGFPPPDIERQREEGYGFFIAELRKNLRFGGCIRIDHIMRLFHHFWIPRGLQPREGAYVLDPYDHLLGILALESVRNQVLVIGEDLGTVQPFVREALEDSGIFSYRLLYFEKDETQAFLPPGAYPVESLMSVTTHDLPTLRGYWLGLDIEERKNLGLFSTEEAYIEAGKERQRDKKNLLCTLIEERMMPPDSSSDPADYPDLDGQLHHAIVGFLTKSRAKLVILNQEDLFKDSRQQNMPGTTWERRNWVTRMRFSTEDLSDNAEVKNYARMYRDWIIETDRLPINEKTSNP